MPAVVRKFSIFYGYPAELIAQWCGVTVHTAKLYKSSSRKASRAVLRLFVLHRDGRVLGDEWPGWKVTRGVLVDEDGNATTQMQLRAYWIVMQYAAELARRDPEEAERFHTLLRRA